MQEIWKQVVGFEGYYEVSNLGNVRGKKRVRSLTLDRTGYKKVTLYKEGKYSTIKVHRLVAIAFIPNPENKREVNHIDGDKSNNRIENLEWCTPSENIKHAFSIGLKKSKSGESHPSAILTEKDVREIRKKYVKSCRKYGSKSLGREYGVSHDCILRIVNNKIWKGVI